MSETNPSLKKEIEELVNKTIEANRVFINEGTNLLKQVTGNPGRPGTIHIFQNDFITKAMNAYASLNVQHLKNMIDLGVALTKQAAVNKEEPPETGANDMAQPAFTLAGECTPGGSLQLDFAIDNDKKEDVTCHLVNSAYRDQKDSNISKSFKTVFTPQSFLLKLGASQAVAIHIQTPKNTKKGLYISDVQAKGFEPSFFSIHLTVI